MKIIKLLMVIISLFLPIRSATVSLSEDFKSKKHEIMIKKILSDDIRLDINKILLDSNDNLTLKKLKIDIVSLVDDEHLLFMEEQRKIYDIPKEIYYRQIWQESVYDPNTKSRAGAIGYMQIMPNTFNWIKNNYDPYIMNYKELYQNLHEYTLIDNHIINYLREEIKKLYDTDNNIYNISDINNPYDNIKCGAYYMRYLKNKIDNRYPEYNEYKKWKRALSSYNAGYSVHNRALRSYKETQNYVKFILYVYKQTA